MTFKSKGQQKEKGIFFKGGVEILCYKTIVTVIKLAIYLNYVSIAAQPWERVFLSTDGDTLDFASIWVFFA